METKSTHIGTKAIVSTLLLIFLLVWPVCSFAGDYSGGGDGSAEYPFKIKTAEDMNEIGDNEGDWDKHFVLVNDIDLAGYTGTKFNIIGTDYDNAFTGVFDGNGHVISNFTYTGTGDVGIFGCVGDFYGGYGRVKCLGLRDPNIHAGGGAALVGSIISGSISHCYVEGGSVTFDFGGGGLVGFFASQVFTPSPIINCYVTCSVSGDSMVGGLVGMAGVPAVITNCYATGRVSGSTYVGGLVGASQGGTISNCSATGNVSGDSKVGGLVGYFYHNAISNCYSAGSVVGTTDVDGLIGYDDTGDYTKSFWDMDVNPDVNGIGNTTDPNVIGKSTSQMKTKSTFTEAVWDFVNESDNGTEDIWTIHEHIDYPKHVWKLVNFVGWDGVDFKDYDYLADWWMETNCNEREDCNGADLDFSNAVDANDLGIFTSYWLSGK